MSKLSSLPPKYQDIDLVMKSFAKGLFWTGAILFLLFPLMSALFQPSGIRRAPQSSTVQTTRTIDLAMFAYANDHDLHYPNGKTSTEVFQQLIDGKYVADLKIFYSPLVKGKREWTQGPLMPENVCYDATSGIDGATPDEVPVVFLTGYHVTYAPGASAIPLPNTYSEGISVCYKSNGAKWIIAKDGLVPNFIPPTFDAKERIYRQLTP